MEKMINNLALLISVKKMIAMYIVAIFGYIAIVSGIKLTSENFMVIVTAIIFFYFGQSTAREARNS